MQMQDRFGRRHDYLRISLVDKCNLRCTYCMPENVRFLPAQHLMSADELVTLARLFVEEGGVKKIRLTGGEPLLRKDVDEIVTQLSRFPVELALTTNGLLLPQHLQHFRTCGLRAINISLDTLREDRFLQLTRRPGLEQVKEAISESVQSDFHIKVNVVVLRDQNEDELIDFVEWTRELPIHVRFIEFMPFEGNAWNRAKVVGYAEMLKRISRHFPIQKLNDDPHSTAKAYRVPGFSGTFAVISTITQPFCGSCNRLRLTADGKIRNCLFARGETDLLTALRRGEDLKPLIRQNLLHKHAQLGGLDHLDASPPDPDELSDRAMVKIGG